MGGSCSMPLAAYATLDAGYLNIQAAWGDPEGRVALVRARAAATAADLSAADALGLQVAAQLKDGVLRAGGSLNAEHS